MEFETLRFFCIKKLAQILFECVECPGDRAETDWLTAEKFIDGSDMVHCLSHSPMMGFLRKFQVAMDYEDFDKTYGRYIWDRGYQAIKPHLHHPPYGRILFE